MAEALRWYGREQMPCAELHHLAHTRNPRAVSVAAHRPAVSELVLVLRGRLALVVDGRRLDLRGGQIAASLAGGEKAVLPTGSRGEYLWLGLGGGPGPALLDATESAAWSALPAALARTPRRLDTSALSAARALVAASAARRPRLARAAAAAQLMAAILAADPPASDDAALAPVHALIAADPVAASALRLDELAARCGLGRSAFCRRWQLATGLSPADAIARARLARAARLLADGAAVAVAAAAVGYRSSSAFAAAWRREHGCPPTRR
jgi:AraC-like DNA-binding protein